MQENNNNCTGIAGIEGSSPNHWIFGRKKTIGSDPKESISKGFSNFYGGDNYPKETFGDTEKKHFSPPNASKEMDWRYQIRIIEEPQPLHKPVRKKLVSEPQKPKEKSTGKSSSFTSCNTNNNKEVLDFTNVPRPKKIIDEETGSRMSEKRGDEKPLEYFFTRKKNNLSKHSSPVITNNDEFYFSGKDVSLGLPPVSEFYIHPNSERLCETLSVTSKEDRIINQALLKKIKEQEREREIQKEIELVKGLDEWLPPSIKQRLEEEEQREKQHEQLLEQRRKKLLTKVQTTKQQPKKDSNQKPRNDKSGSSSTSSRTTPKKK